MMRVVKYDHIVDTVKAMCISAAYNLPADILASIKRAYDDETFPRAKMLLGQIIENAGIAADKKIPICQDTGVAIFFVEIGNNVTIDGGLLHDAINDGVRLGYRDNCLRCSIVDDPLFDRVNTNDNTPAFIHVDQIIGDKLSITLLPKGGGCENMSALKMLKPADTPDDVMKFVCDAVTNAGGNPCPPTVVGVGIGGTADAATLLAKKALLRPIGVYNSNDRYAQLEREILQRINLSGVGPQGFGGRHTALFAAIEYLPCHIASLPVAVNINCHAARKLTVTI